MLNIEKKRIKNLTKPMKKCDYGEIKGVENV